MTLRITTSTPRIRPWVPRGFTLVELLVVVAIIAVVAGVIAPFSRGSLRHMRVRQAALTLAEHLRYAQMLAIDRERATRVTVEAETGGYRVEIRQEGHQEIFGPAPGVAGEFINWPEGVQAELQAEGSAGQEAAGVFLFDPPVRWSAGEVVLANGDEAYRVTIGEGLGHVEVRRIQTDEENPKAGDQRWLDDPL